mmetsp:Transcript_56082/g.156243  ORF Transcript_56082/g.156243 Transcript_56082/m.156243 type:complete len:553 (-) Transcript_56082:36-1694(-)
MWDGDETVQHCVQHASANVQEELRRVRDLLANSRQHDLLRGGGIDTDSVKAALEEARLRSKKNHSRMCEVGECGHRLVAEEAMLRERLWGLRVDIAEATSSASSQATAASFECCGDTLRGKESPEFCFDVEDVGSEDVDGATVGSSPDRSCSPRFVHAEDVGPKCRPKFSSTATRFSTRRSRTKELQSLHEQIQGLEEQLDAREQTFTDMQKEAPPMSCSAQRQGCAVGSRLDLEPSGWRTRKTLQGVVKLRNDLHAVATHAKQNAKERAQLEREFREAQTDVVTSLLTLQRQVETSRMENLALMAHLQKQKAIRQEQSEPLFELIEMLRFDVSERHKILKARDDELHALRADLKAASSIVVFSPQRAPRSKAFAQDTSPGVLSLGCPRSPCSSNFSVSSACTDEADDFIDDTLSALGNVELRSRTGNVKFQGRLSVSTACTDEASDFVDGVSSTVSANGKRVRRLRSRTSNLNLFLNQLPANAAKGSRATEVLRVANREKSCAPRGKRKDGAKRPRKRRELQTSWLGSVGNVVGDVLLQLDRFSRSSGLVV